MIQIKGMFSHRCLQCSLLPGAVALRRAALFFTGAILFNIGHSVRAGQSMQDESTPRDTLCIYGQAVEVSWKGNDAPDLAGYLVLFGTAPGNYSDTLDAGRSTRITIHLQTGIVHHLAVAAYDTANNLSRPSPEITFLLNLEPSAKPGSADADTGAGGGAAKVSGATPLPENLKRKDGPEQDGALFAPTVKNAASSGTIPVEYALSQNFPNPFLRRRAPSGQTEGIPGTRIRFNMPEPGLVSLRIYNLLGEVVASLCEARMPAGSHQVMWDGRDMMGRDAKSGLYLYRLEVQGPGGRRFVAVRKLSLLR